MSIEIRDLDGRVLRRFRRELGSEADLTLSFDSRAVKVVAHALEESEDSAVPACTRTISKRVRPVKRAYFYSRCWSPAYRPGRVIVTCADANFRFSKLRWRRWNRPVTRARGTALVNDCVPFCAGGAFHWLPARVRLAGLKRCPPGESHNGFYAYTALRWRILSSAPYLGALTTGHLRTPCRLYG